MTTNVSLVDLYRKLRPLQILGECEMDNIVTGLDGKVVTLTVLTYNLLSQHHINSEVYPYCRTGVLRSAYRRRHLFAELNAYGRLDIAAFQEVGQFEEAWREELEKDGRMRAVYAEKTGGRDGICLLYDTQKYVAVHEEIVSFAPLMSTLEAVPNIAQILLLSPVTPSTSTSALPTLIVSNTHLFWRPDFDCLRVLQAHRLRKRIEEIRSEMAPEAVPLMCGDWNSDPNSALYHLVTGKINKITRSHWEDLTNSHSRLLRHPLESSQRTFTQVLLDFKKWSPLTSAYSFYTSPDDPAKQGEPPYTSINSYIDTLDYIFTDLRKITVGHLLMLPAEEIVKGQTALPNEIYSSDHLALLVQFNFKK